MPEEIGKIALNAAQKVGFNISVEALEVVKKYATNGREAVNIIQLAGGLVLTEGRKEIERGDIEWVVNSGQYSPRPEKKVSPQPQVGLVNGLAVYGANMGIINEIEVSVIPTTKGQGKIVVTGIVEEEELSGLGGQKIRRKSMAKSSVENVLTVLRRNLDVDPRDYDIHVNFPGGIASDGPSAGVAIATAVYSAIKNIPIDNKIAMTGEVSIRGSVKPVGGVIAKVEAAKQAGANRVLIPKENWQQTFEKIEDIKVIPVERLEEVLELALLKTETDLENGRTKANKVVDLNIQPVPFT